jgi:hypothetical protein
MGLLDEKTRGRKSRDTIPLSEVMQNFKNEVYLPLYKVKTKKDRVWIVGVLWTAKLILKLS